MLSEHQDTEDEFEELNASQNLRCSLAGCPYRTNRTHNLWRHEERHKNRSAEPKPFGCPVCIYSTDKISNLRRHVAIRHPEAAPIEEDTNGSEIQPPAESRGCRIHCQVIGCRYETNRTYDLKRHMLVHNNVEKSHKTYKCSLCMYSSDRKANLKRHLELRHSGIEDTIKTADELMEEQQMLEEQTQCEELLEEQTQREELLEEQTQREELLEEQTQREELLGGLIEDLDVAEVKIDEEQMVEQQAKIEYEYDQLDQVIEPPLITISPCKPPVLHGDISDKQVIALNVNGQLRWFQSIDPPPGASSKLQLALREQEQQAASAQMQMDELDDELALSLAEQDQEEELLVEMLTEDQPTEKNLTWSFHMSNEKLELSTPNEEAKQVKQEEDADFPIWWDDGEYTKMHKNQTFRDLRQKLSKANVQRILRDIYGIYYKPFKKERKQFEVFQIKDSWLCATRMTRMQIIKDMYSKQGT